MPLTWILLASLACWRLTHLLFVEEGPWRLFARLRDAAAGRTPFRSAFTCYLCLSLFVAAPLAYAVGDGWGEKLLAWPAFSAVAILIERWAFPETLEAPPDFHEDEEA